MSLLDRNAVDDDFPVSSGLDRVGGYVTALFVVLLPFALMGIAGLCR